MTLVSFLSGVFADGRARVGDDAMFPDTFADLDLREATELLENFEHEYRDHLPGTPPEFVAPAALYGAITLHRVCQFLVFRDFTENTIRVLLSHDFTQPHTAAVHYSVDLSLRFLPDVFKLAKGKAEGDPLLDEIVALGNRWPLSSVSLPGSTDTHVDEFLDDTCLLRHYVDRIIARKDYDRLKHPRVKQEVIRAIGSFPELAPTISASIGLTNDLQVRKELSE